MCVCSSLRVCQSYAISCAAGIAAAPFLEPGKQPSAAASILLGLPLVPEMPAFPCVLTGHSPDFWRLCDPLTFVFRRVCVTMCSGQRSTHPFFTPYSLLEGNNLTMHPFSPSCWRRSVYMPQAANSHGKQTYCAPDVLVGSRQHSIHSCPHQALCNFELQRCCVHLSFVTVLTRSVCVFGTRADGASAAGVLTHTTRCSPWCACQ